ncbi:MAG: hypothetical protein LJE90_15555 [Betaproteobacteria bacterium]|nr:hypothetical protein [Betaproteobacteria bacterium]
MGLLERVDRMQLAVNDRTAAEDTFARLFGAERARLDESAYLNAWRTVLSIGESELELCEARGPGIVRDFVERWGEGLLCAGYAAARVDALAAHLDAIGAPYLREGDQLYLPGTTTAGFPMVISPLAERARVGPVSFFYEATNTLDSDWRAVADLYTKLFQLDPTKFSPISSARFGYEGTLTLFDPPARLDRIELSQTFGDRPSAMRRFVEKRGGDSLYMCYLETDDYDALQRRLLEGGATLIPRGASIETERDGCWVHPKSLHGLLLGISRESLAWEWSGRPERVQPPPARSR